MAENSNEILYFSTLLDDIQALEDVVVSADALHKQRKHADSLHDRKAHYALTVKATSPVRIGSVLTFRGSAPGPEITVLIQPLAGTLSGP